MKTFFVLSVLLSLSSSAVNAAENLVKDTDAHPNAAENLVKDTDGNPLESHLRYTMVTPFPAGMRGGMTVESNSSYIALEGRGSPVMLSPPSEGKIDEDTLVNIQFPNEETKKWWDVEDPPNDDLIADLVVPPRHKG